MRRARGAWAAGLWALAAGLAGAQAPASATTADVRVRIEGVRSDAGHVLVALCTQAGFLARSCDHAGRAQARRGATEVIVQGVPPGIYAAQAIHDENDNRTLDRTAFGWPLEGLGFSRDAAMPAAPPRFEDAMVEIGPSGGLLVFAMRYF